MKSPSNNAWPGGTRLVGGAARAADPSDRRAPAKGTWTAPAGRRPAAPHGGDASGRVDLPDLIGLRRAAEAGPRSAPLEDRADAPSAVTSGRPLVRARRMAVSIRNLSRDGSWARPSRLVEGRREGEVVPRPWTPRVHFGRRTPLLFLRPSRAAACDLVARRPGHVGRQVLVIPHMRCCVPGHDIPPGCQGGASGRKVATLALRAATTYCRRHARQSQSGLGRVSRHRLCRS